MTCFNFMVELPKDWWMLPIAAFGGIYALGCLGIWMENRR